MKNKTKFKTLDEFKETFFPEGFRQELILREGKKAELTFPEKLLNKISEETSKL